MTDADPATACVVGAGLMGRELAGLLAYGGHTVLVVDIDTDALEAAETYHSNELSADLVDAGYDPDADLAGRFRYATVVDAVPLDSVEFAVEAVIERLSVKQDVVHDLDAALPDTAVIGTNTSSLTAREIAAGIANPERVVLFHFANPAIAHDLVEIAGDDASTRSLEYAQAVAAAFDHWSIVLERERRGNGLSRLSAAVKCAGTWELTQSSPAAVESAARAVGFETGPIALIDSIGLDVHLATVDNLAAEYDDRFAAPDAVRADMETMIADGRLGRKTGAGFFEWSGGEPTLPESPDSADVTPVIAALVNEAHAMVADGITDRDGVDEILKRGSGGDLGPFDLESMFGADYLCEVLDDRREATGAPIYTATQSLRNAADSDRSP